MVSALRYAGFSSTTGCSGSNFFCDDNGGVCCSLPTGFGFSVEFDNLPAGTQGQGYTGNTCGSFLFSVFGPGTKCWSGGGARATHMNWFHSPQGRRSILPVRADNATCAPSGFTYHDESGAEKTIKVPVGEAEAVAALHANKDFAKLASIYTAVEDCHKEADQWYLAKERERMRHRGSLNSCEPNATSGWVSDEWLCVKPDFANVLYCRLTSTAQSDRQGLSRSRGLIVHEPDLIESLRFYAVQSTDICALLRILNACNGLKLKGSRWTLTLMKNSASSSVVDL